jgi:hypothetical protein
MYRSDGEYGDTSRVLIAPGKIEMGASALELKAASTINLITSQGGINTSAIQLDADEGIWIGAGSKVSLFSGNGLDGVSATGASIELSAEHLILGFMEVKKAANDASVGQAIEMTKDYMILASGTPLTGTNSDASLAITGASNGLVGAKFTSTSIGFATQRTGAGTAADPYRYNAIIMNDKGITLGSTNGAKNLATETSANLRSYFSNTNYGSYVRISELGIELGSLADLYINTDNFKL